MTKSSDRFEVADRLQVKIVDALNEETTSMIGHMDASQLLIGILLGFKALEKTMPNEKPESLKRLIEAVNIVLLELVASKDTPMQ